MPRPLQPDGRLHGVVVACPRADGRWLLIRRSARVPAPGMVCFPGGAVEAAETQAHAAAREMREELGVSVEPLRCVWRHDDPRHALTLWAWLGRLQSITLRPDPTEVSQTLWLTLEQAATHPDAPPHQVSLVAALRDAHCG